MRRHYGQYLFDINIKFLSRLVTGVVTIFASPINEVAFHNSSILSKSCFELILVNQIRIEFSDKHRDRINFDSLDAWDDTRC